MKRRARPAPRQRGAALLMAMLTVTLVATFAATALWQQWRAVEVEAAERTRVQSSWLMVGALDWARLVLRLDALNTKSNVDTLAEPWATPLQETRMSSFIASDRGVTSGNVDDLPEVFLSGRIVDVQSRMNVNSLIDAKVQPDPAAQRAFVRLFKSLSLSESEVQRLTTNLQLANTPTTQDASAVPLKPQRFDQLSWLGLSDTTLRILEPHVTVLPGITPINLNTASAEVIAASVPVDLDKAQRFVANRASSPLKDIGEAARLLELDAALGAGFGVASSFFEVQGRLRVGDSIVNERSLVQRNGTSVNALWRERTAGELKR